MNTDGYRRNWHFKRVRRDTSGQNQKDHLGFMKKCQKIYCKL